MAAGTEFSTSYTLLDISYGAIDNGRPIKENISLSLDVEDPATAESTTPTKAGKPPRHFSVMRHCISTPRISNTVLGYVTPGYRSPTDLHSGFIPSFRSGSWSEIGPKQSMEDEHVCIDNLADHLGAPSDFAALGAFYGVFDGHGGTDAAVFVRKNLLKFITEDPHFPKCVDKAVKSAFIKTDHAFADTQSLDRSSGTTALASLIFGRTMLIANAGDCRAVLGKRGRAVELSRDHKPGCNSERLRIESLGGSVYDGYLNGQLSVARAIGDWHMKGAKGSSCPLSAEPELHEWTLTEEDEFLIMGCDGLWDVMSSQCAVTIARKELMAHNDPEKCSRELVHEALKRSSCDNLTVLVVCFSPDPPLASRSARTELGEASHWRVCIS